MTSRLDAALSAEPGDYPAPMSSAAAGGAPAPRSAAARRRTSRKSLVAAVLVVLLGGLLALVAAQALTQHSEVLAVARDVPLGTAIAAEDLTVANVTSDPNLSPIPASERPRILGMITQVALVRGELLTRAQVGTSDGFAPGEMLVALPLKDGQVPARGLTPGQQTLIVATPGSGGSLTPNGGVTGASGSQPITATVVDVGRTNPATQVTVVDVRVGSGDGTTVAALASTGNLALVLLPAGR